MIVHAEDAARDQRRAAGPRRATTRRSCAPARARPRTARSRRSIEAARATGGRVHILHLSSADALPTCAPARAAGADVTVETCPHYLTLDAEDDPGRRDAVQVLPADPRRTHNRDRLWDGLADGRHRHGRLRPLARAPRT